ncbi:MAG: ATP-dependent RecD-like DNA helicase [Candidatus Dependentiae bacterium ADurb.Bin331]|nr:MAG: ATP-dependent RecD-like DNA helicase [Candidatus Dependentiae bacterium ADurb.Bin331]
MSTTNDNEQLSEQLDGTIERFVYQHPQNGFSVAVMSTKAHRSLFVTGYLNAVHPGQRITAHGQWITHPKFGRQFEVTEYVPHLPTTELGITKYLGSGLIKGIGPIYATKLVEKFGKEVLTIIENEPQRLEEIEGIGPKRAEIIAQAWQAQKHISTLMIFLQDKDVSPAYSLKIYKKYGSAAIALLKENPFRLAEDIWGIGFKTADKIAQKLGCAKHAPSRIKAGITHLLSTATGSGHIYCQIAQLKKEVVELLDLNAQEHEPLIKIALHELYEAQKIKLISYNEQHFITLSAYYATEFGIAQNILTLLNYKTNHKFDLNAVYRSLCEQDKKGIMLNEDQQKAILAVLQSKVTIITGGPGTGKTTLIKKLLELLDSYHVRYQLAAPTGRAAKRMMEGTGRHAMTLHRMLEFDPNTMGFAHNEKNALSLDFLIIDEASMLDIFLTAATLKAVPHTAHIVFIGDIDQLPSVGAGNVLNDLIASGKVQTIRLTHIFRQAQDSLIITNAHRINNGEFPVSSLPDAKKDFFFIKEDDPQNLFAQLQKVYKSLLPRYGFSSPQSMVLVPMNRGIAGTFTLNSQLQQLFNPAQKETITSNGTTYKIDDRVMQIRNNYEKLVFNGDIGTVTAVNTVDQQLTVSYGDRLVLYETSELDELVLAYAISIHKSQGSEYDVAIIPIFMQHFVLLQRNLVYTALTRAKKLCIFIGQPKAVAMAIKNNKGTVRTTFLQQFLTTSLTCR